jgi:DNA replicative helicase MCM subunit Mcm2 (Cdc46/Mcm family)
VAVLGADQNNFEDGDELQLPESEARKRFSQFLRTETRSLGSDEPYSGQLMRQKGKNRVLDVDLQDVKNYDDVLGQLLEENPNTYLPWVCTLCLSSVHRPLLLMLMQSLYAV